MAVCSSVGWMVRHKANVLDFQRRRRKDGSSLVLGRDTAKNRRLLRRRRRNRRVQNKWNFFSPDAAFFFLFAWEKEEEKRFLSIPLLPTHFFFFLFFTQGRISLSLSFTPPLLLLRSGEFYCESIFRLLPFFCSFHSRVPTGLFPQCEKKSEFPFCVYTFVRYC